VSVVSTTGSGSTSVHADEARIGKTHRDVGILVHHREHRLLMVGEAERNLERPALQKSGEDEQPRLAARSRRPELPEGVP
jgi:hypothetical protein